MRARLSVLLLSLAAAAPASAAPFPEYDPVLACRGVTSYGPKYNRKICIQGYEDQKAIAQAEWPKVPAAIQEKCTKVANTDAAWKGSYYFLKDCLKKHGFAKD